MPHAAVQRGCQGCIHQNLVSHHCSLFVGGRGGAWRTGWEEGRGGEGGRRGVEVRVGDSDGNQPLYSHNKHV